MEIRRAEPQDIEAVLPLFVSYREFYKRETDVAKAMGFLSDNLELGKSVIFVAYDEFAKAVGFAQLYLQVSSLSMSTYIYLSDLFVDSQLRSKGIGKELLKAVNDYGTAIGAKSIQLETAVSNVQAQKLYESCGYKWDKEFRTYVFDKAVAPATAIKPVRPVAVEPGFKS